ncbi:uncharacterized protein Z520_06771 [Fonsecaea multimorphosa CBS 102226]|uniref:CENP-V/GFA domain-containing protein n=1 Tax=Fonsecaea multimorphosa CBS 102226 TaxID=1442371 RepID=A0A0D2K2L3_9EURO|nr:uncharacterized protein Z520_06771 [Fonsecaea multimorphosa CBS 102226]KIX97319.1 hypothetical protein Z520_06771 [Fonsecaea multimorphosa CBS 102226]OAL23286.1 hypothetical protein AYO22_06336 [Fonsecaea multimorphosa]
MSLTIPSAALPLKSALCHCSSCRHATGQLFATWAVIPADLPPDVLSSGKLVKHESSRTCQRWFCRRCGASVINIDAGQGEEEWEVGTGVLYLQVDDDREKGLQGRLNRVQLWVEDVRGDGGAVGWINQGKLQGMDRHWRGRESEMVSDDAVRDLLMKHSKAPVHASREYGDERLVAQCRCKIVRFEVSHPPSDYNAGTGKFGASLDACTSCRTVTGFEITCWATVPKSLIMVADQTLESLLVDRARLGHYKTSSDVSRYFCAKCGATVFYYKHGLETIDIGLGLLEPKIEGAVRLESWLEWQKYPKCLVYEEDAVDAAFVRNLKEGMRHWEGR